MLIKILGIFDLIAALLFFSISFGLDIPKGIIIFFIVVLFLKGAFILTKSIASGVDILAAIILLLSFSFTLPKILIFIPAVLLIQKGFLSLIS